MSKYIITCEDCDWIGAETLTDVHLTRSGFVERCPACQSEKLSVSVPLRRPPALLEPEELAA